MRLVPRSRQTACCRYRWKQGEPELSGERSLHACLIAGMAGTAGLGHFLEVFCETGGVGGLSEGRQPGGGGRIIGRRLIEPGAIFPDRGARLRKHRRLTLASSRRKHARKSL